MTSIDWDDVEKKIGLFITKLGPSPIVKEDLALFPYMKRMKSNTDDLLTLIDLVSPNPENLRRISLILLIVVFGLIEGSLTIWFNVCIYQLIRTGHHDIWDEIRQRFATTFDDISSIRLAVKLSFLERHGLDFIDQIANRELRNAFAHQNYSIDDQGIVSIYRKQKIVNTYSREDFLEIIKSLTKFLELNTRSIASLIGIDFDNFVGVLEKTSIEEMKELTKMVLDEKNKNQDNI